MRLRHTAQLLQVFSLAFCAVTLTAIAKTDSPSSPPSAPATVTEVRMGFGLPKPPYIMEEENEGIEVEIANQALAAAGLKMIAQYLPPSRGLNMLHAGRIDGIMTVDEGIGDNYYFSDSYVDYQNVAITLSSRHIELNSIDDLTHYSLAGFQNASVILGPQFKEMTAHHKDYKEYPYQLIQDNLLYKGRVDVVVGDRLIFRYFSTHMPPSIDASQPITFHPIFPPNPRKVAFRSAELRDRFNEGLKIIRSNGTYDEILKKYQRFMQP